MCTQILADHGAVVTKVEPPAGDETRRLGPPYTASQQAAYFSALNRGKQSISLDLSTPDGQQVLHGLLANADVLVENFVPGTLERWGLGYEEVLAARYPRLVLCSISGFGADGPLGGLPGYDAVLQAACGIMSINGSEGSGATKVGIPVVDHLTGYVALSGILMALQARARDTGTALYEGHQLVNVPKRRASLHADYTLPFAPALAVTGGWRYASANAATVDGGVRAPAYHVVDLGLRFKQVLGDHPVTWNLAVDNVFNRFYWRDTGSSAGDYY
ncbi:MAG: TonB-dependent receptor, partial [Comamonas sp.]